MPSGGLYDPNSARNAPLNAPADNLPDTRFNSTLDYLEVAASGIATITHPAVTGLGSAAAGFAVKYATNADDDDQRIALHTLGYVPFALLAAGDNIVWPGMPVVTNSDGGAWYVAPYATTTDLRIGAKATIGASNLSSTAVDYSYLIFKAPPDPSGTVLLEWDPDTGVLSLGLGKWRSDRQYLMIAPDGSPFGFAMGRTIDLNNGAPKAWTPDGTAYAPVPSTLKSYLPWETYNGGDLGGETTGVSMGYGGTGTAPPAILVQAP